MHFKNPLVLYALCLLAIPLLVHLFQLRRYKPTDFTNLKFLKKAVQQTRKSAQLKKFLVLFTRLLLLAALVVAFAEPYLPSNHEIGEQSNHVIYLDNSYSMQAKGKNGVLLKRSIQDLLENLPEGESVSIFTNDDVFEATTKENLRDELQEIEFSPVTLPWKAVELQAGELFKTQVGVQNNFIAISDFNQLETPVSNNGKGVHTYLIKQEAVAQNNLSLDTVYVVKQTVAEIHLEVIVSSAGKWEDEISIGIYNAENLLSRKSIYLTDNNKGVVDFTIALSEIPFGKIEIEDNALDFDNKLFFSIHQIPAINVAVIGDTEPEFLKKIFTAPEYSLQVFSENNVDFNQLLNANVVVLNEPENLPLSIQNSLKQLQAEQAVLCIIPSNNVSAASYEVLLKNLGIQPFEVKTEREKLITTINFDHPLYRDVFQNKVSNFDYPQVQQSFDHAAGSSAVLKYADGQPFLFQQGNTFVFTAALNSENSNFKNSPLVVPTFDKMKDFAFTPIQLYQILGNTNKVVVPAELRKDEVLKVTSASSSFIPQQQHFQKKVELNFDIFPKKPGHYELLQANVPLRSLSFNVDRKENRETSITLKESEGVSVQTSLPGTLSQLNSSREVNSLWKWFVILALIFLLTEMLILKFFK